MVLPCCRGMLTPCCTPTRQNHGFALLSWDADFFWHAITALSPCSHGMRNPCAILPCHAHSLRHASMTESWCWHVASTPTWQNHAFAMFSWHAHTLCHVALCALLEARQHDRTMVLACCGGPHLLAPLAAHSGFPPQVLERT